MRSNVQISLRALAPRGTPAERWLSIVGPALNVSADSSPEQWCDRVPRDGPVLVVCNHPYGGVEALILAAALQSVRTDIKFLANGALRVFREFALLIITEALTQRPSNARLVREARRKVVNQRRRATVLVAPGRRFSKIPERSIGHAVSSRERALVRVQHHVTRESPRSG